MAERYHKDSKDRVVLHTQITAEAKLYLHELAGEFGLNYAIELLVNEHRARHSEKDPPKKSYTILHSNGK